MDLTATVHGPYTPLGIRKHTVYLVGFDLGAQMFAHLDRHTVQDTGAWMWILTYQAWTIRLAVINTRCRGRYSLSYYSLTWVWPLIAFVS